MLNRRRWLGGMATAAIGSLLRPLSADAFAFAATPTYSPRFVDVGKEAGLLSKTVLIGHESKDFLLSTTGGGIALFDYDNDGWLDIFVGTGWGLKDFPKGEEPTNHLYRNNRNGTFTNVTEKAGLVRHGWGQGVCVGDYDNDGNLDLFVTYYGRNILYHNNGDGTFTDVTRKSGLLTSENMYSTGAAFLDCDRNGHLDLFVSHYCAYEEAMRYEPGANEGCRWKGVAVLCGPRGLKG